MGEIDNQMKSVNFTRMADGTAEEYAFLTPLYEKCRNGVSDRLLELLKAMKGDKLGYQVDRYTHSLQSASFCESILPTSSWNCEIRGHEHPQD